MNKVDINSDLGEGFGAYEMPYDKEIIDYVTSANIACGYHASDPITMKKTVALAQGRGVAVGAHTGYPDLLGFGRRNISVSADEVHGYVLYQLGALDGIARSLHMRVSYVKPHGAMYNMASSDLELSRAICRAISEYDRNMPLLALSGSLMEQAAEEYGVRFVSEVFADRAYHSDGSLVSRKIPEAVITDPEAVCSRAIRMVREGKVKSAEGEDISLKADSICVHGDNANAVQLVKKLRDALMCEGVEVVSFV